MSIHNIVRALAAPVAIVLISACSTADPVTAVAGTATPGASTPGTSTTTVKARRGFIWSAETGLKVIPLPNYATSMNVTAMNNRGQVVGYVTIGEGTENDHAFIWSAEAGFNALGSLTGPDGISMALSIDDSGVVKGLSEGPSTKYNGPMGIYLEDSFAWTESSAMKAASPPENPPEFKSVANGGKLILPQGDDCLEVRRINSEGQAIGYAGSTIGTTCRANVALMWDRAGNPVVMDKCGSRPWCGNTVRDINNRGEVVGYRDSHGYRWTASGGFVSVPFPGAALYVINDIGTAAGAAGTGEILKPIVWMISGDVKTIQLPNGATYGYAVAINDRGQVSGSFQ